MKKNRHFFKSYFAKELARLNGSYQVILENDDCKEVYTITKDQIIAADQSVATMKQEENWIDFASDLFQQELYSSMKTEDLKKLAVIYMYMARQFDLLLECAMCEEERRDYEISIFMRKSNQTLLFRLTKNGKLSIFIDHELLSMDDLAALLTSDSISFLLQFDKAVERAKMAFQIRKEKRDPQDARLKNEALLDQVFSSRRKKRSHS